MKESDLVMKKTVALLLAFCFALNAFLMGCVSNEGGDSKQISDADATYEALTESDKAMCSMLLYQIPNPQSIVVKSIRLGNDVAPYSIELEYADNGEVVTQYYMTLDVLGRTLLVGVVFSDPTEWDFAEESKYDVKGINKCIQERAKKLFGESASSAKSQMELTKEKFDYKKTFYYLAGDESGNHAVSRIDVQGADCTYYAYEATNKQETNIVDSFDLSGDWFTQLGTDGKIYFKIHDESSDYTTMQGWQVVFSEDGTITGLIDVNGFPLDDYKGIGSFTMNILD